MQENDENKPTVTLRFESEDAKRNFMANLSDGDGEDMCELKWPWEDGIEFHECNVFDVIVPDYEDR